jgi:hypothetical protein
VLPRPLPGAGARPPAPRRIPSPGRTSSRFPDTKRPRPLGRALLVTRPGARCTLAAMRRCALHHTRRAGQASSSLSAKAFRTSSAPMGSNADPGRWARHLCEHMGARRACFGQPQRWCQTRVANGSGTGALGVSLSSQFRTPCRFCTPPRACHLTKQPKLPELGLRPRNAGDDYW